MPAPDFFIKLGDTASVLRQTLLDDNDDPVNIGGATVRLHAKLLGGTPLLDDAAQNLQSGTLNIGEVQYGWGTQLGEAGVWLGEWEVTYASGLKQTFPNSGYFLIRVPEQIA